MIDPVLLNAQLASAEGVLMLQIVFSSSSYLKWEHGLQESNTP